MVTFEIGDTFDSYAEFLKRLHEYQKQEHVLFIIQHSKKLCASADLCERIKYQFAIFVCKQGKRRRPSESKGIRPRQRTFKLGCDARIKIIARKENDRVFLYLRRAQLEHSKHPINAQTYSVYPENRKVEADEKLISLFKANAELREVKDYIKKQHGVDLLRREIHSLRRRLVQKMNLDIPYRRFSTRLVYNHPETELESFLRDLITEGGMSQYNKTENGHVKDLTFATRLMGEDLKQFPDVLIMDCIENVSTEGITFLTVMSIDCNGRGRPVLHSFLSNTAKHCILAFLRVLKELCSGEEPKLFFIDKDFVKSDAVLEIFPNTSIKVLAFGAVAKVKKVLHRLTIPAHRHQSILELFKEQKETASSHSYLALQGKIGQLLTEGARIYFCSTWWDVPEQWAFHASQNVNKLPSTAMQCMESYQIKIKLGYGKLLAALNVKDCVQRIITRNAVFSEAWEEEAVMASMRGWMKSESPLAQEIRDVLTPFGADLVLEQMNLTEKTTYHVDVREESVEYSIREDTSLEHEYVVRSDLCSCDFFTSFRLPCHHIFALRSYLQLPAFTLIPSSKFNKRPCHVNQINPESGHQSLQSHHRGDLELTEVSHNDFENDSASNEADDDIGLGSPVKAPPSSQAGRELNPHSVIDQNVNRRLTSLTSRMTDCLMGMETPKFNRAMAQLEKFIKLVQENKPYVVTDCSQDDIDPEHQTPTPPTRRKCGYRSRFNPSGKVGTVSSPGFAVSPPQTVVKLVPPSSALPENQIQAQSLLPSSAPLDDVTTLNQDQTKSKLISLLPASAPSDDVTTLNQDQTKSKLISLLPSSAPLDDVTTLNQDKTKPKLISLLPASAPHGAATISALVRSSSSPSQSLSGQTPRSPSITTLPADPSVQIAGGAMASSASPLKPAPPTSASKAARKVVTTVTLTRPGKGGKLQLKSVITEKESPSVTLTRPANGKLLLKSAITEKQSPSVTLTRPVNGGKLQLKSAITEKQSPSPVSAKAPTPKPSLRPLRKRKLTEIGQEYAAGVLLSKRLRSQKKD